MQGTAERYHLLVPIGSGTCATVYLATDRESGLPCSVKKIRKEAVAGAIDKVRREINLMRSLHHNFIVRFFDSCEDDDHFYIVMELCEMGTLFNVLFRTGRLREEIAIIYITELAFALKYLHREQNIIHRDIKVENILVDGNGHVRLCDFGFSTITEDEAPHKRTACGSVAYAAPEMICHEAYTNKTDIWSLGIVFYVLLVGTVPFVGSTVHECMKAIMEQELVIPEFVSPAARDLLCRMLDKDQKTRLDIIDVLAHPCIFESRLFKNISRVAESGPHEYAFDGSNAIREDRRIMGQRLGTAENNFSPASIRQWRSASRSLNWKTQSTLMILGRGRRQIHGSRSLMKGLNPTHIPHLRPVTSFSQEPKETDPPEGIHVEPKMSVLSSEIRV